MKKPFVIGGAAIAAFLLGKAAISERLAVRSCEIRTAKINAPFRLAHISDLHESRFGKGQQELISLLQKIKPDLIVLTGDIVEDDDDLDPMKGEVIHAFNPSRPLLEAAVKIAPCYMVLGNHESNIPHTNLLCDELERLHIHVLHRAHLSDPDMAEEILVNGNRIHLCGADDPYFDRFDHPMRPTLSQRIEEDCNHHGAGITCWRNRLSGEYAQIADDSRLTLLLSHRPEEFELYQALGFDAAFSGHAHGGQFRIPFLMNGLYAPHQGIFPKHAGGIYRYSDFTHVVSRGLSKKRMVRIFNRPEIWCVDFVPEGK